MDIEIRKLTPDLAEDYVRFFDTTSHDVNIDDRKCYCVTWRNDDSYAGNDHWYPTREERRSHAFDFVRTGNIQGYLAYHNGKIVGWCNANADCHVGVDYLRSVWPIMKNDTNVKVKSIFCFMIAPEVQRMGVATKLLERVCQDAAADGFDYVEAYTIMDSGDAAHNHRGPVGMYEKCGFTKNAVRGDKVVMRKSLK